MSKILKRKKVSNPNKLEGEEKKKKNMTLKEYREKIRGVDRRRKIFELVK